MSTARDMMHPGADCVGAEQTLAEAARMMAERQVGSLPVCGADERLQGIITDRDIVTKCVALGHDPGDCTAGELATGDLAWVRGDADQAEVLELMTRRGVRRVPVIDDRRLVGMISEADLARHLDDAALTGFVHDIYGAPPNN
ncbi:CBS domain-containing protein [Actinorhabdospora filicis]|nr:CBS domain-containing protein [Actinorhabdospora filicis]